MSLAMSLAKEFEKLSASDEAPEPLVSLRLQKLLYYAQAWSIRVRQSDLFDARIEAWKDGPVVPEVYEAMPAARGSKPITPEMFEDVPDTDEDSAAFVASVWEAYKKWSAAGLCEKTHEEWPWIKARGNLPAGARGNGEISVDDLLEFFSSQDMPGPIAEYEHRILMAEQEAVRKLAEMPPLDVERLWRTARIKTPEAEAMMAAGN